MSQEVPYKLQKYTVLEILGEGTFGQVAKCFNPKTSEVVAVKVLKQADGNLQREVEILHRLSQLQPDSVNIVKYLDYFTHNSFKCMAFEMLDRSLLVYMRQRQSTLELSEVRVIAQQLLVAFAALKQVGVVHADLKADNVMLVNHKDQPLRVKLIDFGEARLQSELKRGTTFQPCALRAPEVTLGLPLSTAMDMWTLGCCLVQCYLGCGLFSGTSPYNNLRTIMKLLGMPSGEMLDTGIFTRRYFAKIDGQWRFRSPEEYYSITDLDPKVKDCALENLEDAILANPAQGQLPELDDQMSFLSFIKALLQLDPEKRITPSQALNHPFITAEKLKEDNGEYAQWARELMALVLSYTSAPQHGNDKEQSTNSSHVEFQPSPTTADRPGSSHGDIPNDTEKCPTQTEVPDTQWSYSSSKEYECIEIDDDCLHPNNECIEAQNKCILVEEHYTSTSHHMCSDIDEETEQLDNPRFIHPFVEVDDRIDLEFTEHPDIKQEEENYACYCELDTRIEADFTDADISLSYNEQITSKPEYVIIDIEECAEVSSSVSNTFCSTVFNSIKQCFSWTCTAGLALVRALWGH